MNLLKFSLLSFFLSFALIFSLSVQAEEVKTTVEGSGSSNIVATVDIEDAHIVSQEGNKFKIYFNFTNEEGLQTGVKYGIQLIEKGADHYADEKVYDESVTLYENAKQSREIEYTAPGNLSGTYILQLVSMNESSFPFGIASLGEVKLASTMKIVDIDTKSCYLQVVGDKAGTKYKLLQSVDIKTSEDLKLTCTAVNNTAGAISMTPVFQTRYMSAFGKVAPTYGGDSKPITFAKGEKKTFSVEIPKDDMPQFYSVMFFLKGDTTYSNSVIARYIVAGVSGSIDKVSLDKDYYTKGDEGSITLGWQARAGQYVRTSGGNSTLPEVTFEAKMTNDKGGECIAPIKQVLKWNVNKPRTIIPFKVNTKCVNPKVSATMTDKDGNILDQKEFTFESSNTADEKKALPMKSIVIGGVALLAVIALGVYMKRKNINTQNGTV